MKHDFSPQFISPNLFQPETHFIKLAGLISDKFCFTDNSLPKSSLTFGHQKNKTGLTDLTASESRSSKI